MTRRAWNSTIGIGLIGGSGAFGRFIASALPLVPGVTLAALAGSNPERTSRAADELHIPWWTTNYEELIARHDVALVIIATRPSQHADMALAAVRSDKAVFVEKPVATDLRAAVTLQREAVARGVPVGIDYVMRYSPVYRGVGQLVRDAPFGALRRIEFRNDAGDEGLAADHWFWNPEQSGGIFIEHGVHFFDIYGSLAGAPPVEVHGITSRRSSDGPEDVVHADVRYANGVLASFTHAFDKPSLMESQEGLLVFDHGYARITGWTPTSMHLEGLVDSDSRARLDRMADLRIDTLRKFSSDEGRMRGRGVRFQATEYVRVALTPEQDAQELYRRAVADALTDFVSTMRNPAHRPIVALDDAVRSLAVACVAAGAASMEDLLAAYRATTTEVAAPHHTLVV